MVNNQNMGEWCNNQNMITGLKAGKWKHYCNKLLKVKWFDGLIQPTMLHMVWCSIWINEVTDDDGSSSTNRWWQSLFNLQDRLIQCWNDPHQSHSMILGLGFWKCTFNFVAPLWRHFSLPKRYGVFFGGYRPNRLDCQSKCCGTRNWQQK